MPISTHSHHKFCDLIAKGGVTSGVVYPAAIAKLSTLFSFRNLGGTSVGAIAAAAAAAAEYGRRNGGPDNFHHINDLAQVLSTRTVGDQTKLFNLFQPHHNTKKLFAVLTAGLGKKFPILRLIVAMSWRFWHATALAILLCGILAWPILTHPNVPIKLIGGIIALAVTIITTVLFGASAFAIQAIRVLPRSYYGLCTGRSSPRSERNPALSEWLADYLDDLANLSKGSSPLTFGNLWWPDVPSGEKRTDYEPDKPTTAEEINARFINLEMIATSISEGRPYRLPFRQDFDVRENRSFWYKPEELEQFLPEHIVTWIMNHPRPSRRLDDMKQKGFYPLPEPWNLPVVAAVRLSLSFPLLMTAIPLYIAKKNQDPEVCWFSDGGICSNFPIHFFDAPIPEWPTFAINLSDKTRPTQPDVWMMQHIGDGTGFHLSNFDYAYGQGDLQKASVTETSSLQKVIAFGKAILFTMHNWNDNTQTVMPGNRDRIVLVSLEPQEGGLNLNMPPDTIAKLSQQGTAAADELIARFGDGKTHSLGLENHRWVRLKAMLSAMEEYLVKLNMSCSQLESGLSDFVIKGPGKYYEWHKGQGQVALSVLTALRSLGSALSKNRPLSETAPRPRPELRPRVRL